MADCGTRASYAAGCRCLPCRAANARYEADRQARIADGTWGGGRVDASVLRDHLQALSDHGLGYKTVAATAGVAKSSLLAVATGRRQRVLAATARAVLVISVDDAIWLAADHALVDARHSWSIIGGLRRAGYSKAAIGRWVTGNPAATSLQLGRRRITAAAARRVLRLQAAHRNGEITPADLTGDVYALTGVRHCRTCGEQTDGGAQVHPGCAGGT